MSTHGRNWSVLTWVRNDDIHPGGTSIKAINEGILSLGHVDWELNSE